MSEAKKYRHINVQVPRDLYVEFQDAVPWGLRMLLFRNILQLILDAVQDGQIVLGAIMSGEYKLTLARRVQNLNKDTTNGPTG